MIRGKRQQIGLTASDKVIFEEIIKHTREFEDRASAITKSDIRLFSFRDMLYMFHRWKRKIFGEKVLNRADKQKKIISFVKHCLHRNLANYDTMVLLTGVRGGGKSSTAIQLARVWCKLIGIRFKPRRHIAYSNKDVMDLCDKLNKFEPLIADEAIRFATAENWNKAENKELKMKLGQIRTKHLFYILCFPINITKLDKTYLNDYVNYWIHLYKRGGGAIFIKDENIANDPWCLDAMKKVGSWNEFTPPEMIERKLETHSNFWDSINIPVVPKALYEKYLEVREENIYNDSNIRALISETDVHKSALLLTLEDIMSKDKTMSSNRILKYVENKYGIIISRSLLSLYLKDAKDMINKFDGDYGNTKKEVKKLEEDKVEEVKEVEEIKDIEEEGNGD